MFFLNLEVLSNEVDGLLTFLVSKSHVISKLVVLGNNLPAATACHSCVVKVNTSSRLWPPEVDLGVVHHIIGVINSPYSLSFVGGVSSIGRTCAQYHSVVWALKGIF